MESSAERSDAPTVERMLQPASSAHCQPCFDISVVICTRNRAESLRQLLECFVRDRHDGIDFEIVIVDNGDTEGAREVVSIFSRVMNVRYLVEERPGKCHALNRALDEGGLGEIVAILDDDLTLEPGWLRGVKAGCEKWPEHDIFSGRSHVVFPENVPIPGWAYNKEFEGLAFSVNDPGIMDREMRRGFYPSGNHFWVRSRVLHSHRRFPALWLLPEPGLILGLYEEGARGVWIGDVAVGHHIQPHLLEPNTILLRMVQYGKDFPYVRMPNPSLFWPARVFRRFPRFWVVLCVLNAMRWYAKYARARLIGDFEKRFLAQMKATIRLHDNLETVCHWRRIRRFVAEGRIEHTTKQARKLGRFYDQA